MNLAKKTQRILCVMLVVLLSTGITISARAETEATGTLTPLDDAYTWIVSATASYDNSTLGLSFSGSPSPRASRVSYLKFDLSGITFPIVKARLNLAAVTGCVSPDPVNVAVYGTLDVYHNTTTPWAEAGLTWANQPDLDPMASAPLITLDEGVVQVAGGYHHWTDTGTGDFAAWLEAQRSGDGIATLRLEIVANPSVTVEDEVWFDDHEGTAAGLATCISSGGPMLQVSDDEGPLSITLLNLQAKSQPAGNWAAWIGLAVLLLLSWIWYSWYSMKKRAM